MNEETAIAYLLIGLALVLARLDTAYPQHVERVQRAPSPAVAGIEILGTMVLAVLAWPWFAWVWIVEEE